MCDDPGWREIALIGSLSEEITEDERRRREMEAEEKEKCAYDYCAEDCEPPTPNTDDPPDEDPYP